MPLALFLYTQDCVLLHQLSRLCDCNPSKRNSNNKHAHKEKIFTKPNLVSKIFEEKNLGFGQTPTPLVGTSFAGIKMGLLPLLYLLYSCMIWCGWCDCAGDGGEVRH